MGEGSQQARENGTFLGMGLLLYKKRGKVGVKRDQGNILGLESLYLVIDLDIGLAQYTNQAQFNRRDFIGLA